ncbi:hypothetical protein [Priestia megaterium]|uniref:Uncharacterized protein n=1 Tax=Priestia megaterium TaxID=1404 RepID=A0A6M6DRM6_PRIMG|nr:hypothetical protein [Priestia megaterium]QJX74728.1 hypothetical protein FDZ14_00480 [Priestia megaterium]
MQIQGQYSLSDFIIKISGGYKLSDFNEEYEKIMRSSITQYTKDVKLAELMTLIEGVFSVPLLRDEEWERNNKKVIAMYRKISNSRKLV